MPTIHAMLVAGRTGSGNLSQRIGPYSSFRPEFVNDTRAVAVFGLALQVLDRKR